MRRNEITEAFSITTDAFSFIWSLETVAVARKKRQLPSIGKASSSRCTSCQTPNIGIWPYPNGLEQLPLPTLQQVLTRHEEPGTRSSQSQMSLAAFLKPAHRRSKAGTGSISVSAKVNDLPVLPPSPNLSIIYVETDTAHQVEAHTSGRSSADDAPR